ncbi:MAG: hypothetical protein NDI82_11170 [Anaeromyxobacteraceae bacterium]|nr:hypothetical protein [Anaeromyxobacteraceae bacterium]
MPSTSAAPGRPAAPPLVLAALAWLAGCTGGLDVPSCPGDEVATLELAGARVSAACAGDGVPANGSAACAAADPPVTVDCQAVRPAPPCCFDLLFPPILPFRAVVAFGDLDASAAFCVQRPGSTPYLGTHTAAAGGDELTVSADTSGAVLAACAATCAVTVHHEVTGLLARDPLTGAVTGFTGQAVQTASATPSADCAPCATPCTAIWSLARAP